GWLAGGGDHHGTEPWRLACRLLLRYRLLSPRRGRLRDGCPGNCTCQHRCGDGGTHAFGGGSARHQTDAGGMHGGSMRRMRACIERIRGKRMRQPGRPPHPCGNQAAASLSFLSGRTFSLVDAGLAANHCSSLVNGLMPLRRGLAGTLTAVIFSRPGSVKEPAPFLLTEAATADSSDAITARTSRGATPEFAAMWATRPDLFSASLIGFGAAGLAAAFGAAFFFAAFFVLAIIIPMLLVRGIAWRGLSAGGL